MNFNCGGCAVTPDENDDIILKHNPNYDGIDYITLDLPPKEEHENNKKESRPSFEIFIEESRSSQLSNISPKNVIEYIKTNAEVTRKLQSQEMYRNRDHNGLESEIDQRKNNDTSNKTDEKIPGNDVSTEGTSKNVDTEPVKTTPEPAATKDFAKIPSGHEKNLAQQLDPSQLKKNVKRYYFTDFHDRGPITTSMRNLYEYLRNERSDVRLEGELVIDWHLYMYRTIRRICDNEALDEAGRNKTAILWFDGYVEFRNKFNVAVTERSLLDTPVKDFKKWIVGRQPKELLEDFPVYFHGNTTNHMPVLYYAVPDAGLFKKFGYEVVRSFIIDFLQAIERLIISLRAKGSPIHGYVLCVDMASLCWDHYGVFSDFRKKGAKLAKEVFEHYPNSVMKVCCINAPGFMQTAWKTICNPPFNMVSAQQQQKFFFADSPLEGIQKLGVTLDQIPEKYGGTWGEPMELFTVKMKDSSSAECDMDQVFPGPESPENFPEIWDEKFVIPAIIDDPPSPTLTEEYSSKSKKNKKKLSFRSKGSLRSLGNKIFSSRSNSVSHSQTHSLRGSKEGSILFAKELSAQENRSRSVIESPMTPLRSHSKVSIIETPSNADESSLAHQSNTGTLVAAQSPKSIRAGSLIDARMSKHTVESKVIDPSLQAEKVGCCGRPKQQLKPNTAGQSRSEGKRKAIHDRIARNKVKE